MKKPISLFVTVYLMGTTPYCLGKVLLSPASVSEAEYTSALGVYDDALSPVEDYLQRSPNLENANLLAQLFTEAEKAFVESVDVPSCVPLYQKVLSLESTDDWDETQRKLFLISYLRLLQIDPPSETEETKNQWKGKALFYLDRMEAPADLIPPSVFRNLESEKSRFPLMPVHLPEEMKNRFQKILVQGQVFPTNKPFSLRQTHSPLRWTFLSHFYEPMTFKTPIEKLSGKKQAPRPFVKDDCPLSATGETQKDVQFYQPLHCTLTVQSRKAPAKEILLPKAPSKSGQSWIKKKKSWILIGVGLAAAAVVLSQTHKDKGSSSSPTESYGF